MYVCYVRGTHAYASAAQGCQSRARARARAGALHPSPRLLLLQYILAAGMCSFPFWPWNCCHWFSLPRLTGRTIAERERSILELLLPRSAVPLPGARKVLLPYWTLVATLGELLSFRSRTDGAERVCGVCTSKRKECSQEG